MTELDAAMVAADHEVRPPKKLPGRGFWRSFLGLPALTRTL